MEFSLDYGSELDPDLNDNNKTDGVDYTFWLNNYVP